MHYREPIFTLMDQTFDVDWHFGTLRETSIKLMNIAKLKNATQHQTWYLGNFSWLNGYITQLFKYQDFLISGESYNISCWLFLFLCKVFTRKKIYLWTHGFYGKENRLEAFLKNIQYGLADGIFTYGDYARQLMMRQGNSGDTIWPIYNSLDYDKHIALRKLLRPTGIFTNHFENNNPVIIFIGRLTRVKRLDLLIDALSKLKERNEMYNVAIIGDGVEMENLTGLTKDYGLEKQVWLYGACYEETTNAELIYNADLCVAPGNIGLTVMHTMVFGTPAATHNNFPYQMPEFEAIQEGITGTFFEYNNAMSIADTISRWFDGPGKNRQKIRENCYTEIDTQWNPYFQIEVLKEHLPR